MQTRPSGLGPENLEWSLLVDRMASLCTTAEGAARIRGRAPASDLEGARALAARVAEAIAVQRADEPIVARAVEPPGELLPRVARGGVGSAAELGQLAHCLELATELRRFVARRREDSPALFEVLTSDARLDALLRELRGAIDGYELRDDATPDLRRASTELGETRGRLSAVLQKLIARYTDVLRDSFYTERDGRFVLPVRADAHRRVEGIIVGSSSSGGTLYVEPAEVTAHGNELQLALAKVERERARALASLSNSVRALVAECERAVEVCIEADVLHALALWAVRHDALAIAPVEEPVLELKAVRHPLLLGEAREVIENDLFLASGQALVISGPNAGGKTVALKCLGLCAWMARSGLPVPVGLESKIGWFSEVMTDIGDDQSLVLSLSSFSGHVENLARILERCERGTLVLLDEIAAGTDPEEGSALAVAVLKALVERGAAVAVTTHYERLKELAAQDERFENASMVFDFERLEPTFRLRRGVPGASSALIVASRHGIPEPVVAFAKALLPEHSLSREELVQKLQAEQHALERARRDADSELSRQRELSLELEAELAKLRDQERRRLTSLRGELVRSVTEAREELRRARQAIKDAPHERRALKDAEKLIDHAAREVAIGAPLEKATAVAASGPRPDVSALLPGMRVRLQNLSGMAEVLEKPVGDRVRVLAGSMKLFVPLSDIERIDRASPRAAPQRFDSSLASVPRPVPLRTPDTTLDLRGTRVDDALTRVEQFVDRLMSRGESFGFVLHGHGTGALKSAVREFLNELSWVDNAEPASRDQGGDALTVFSLRS